MQSSLNLSRRQISARKLVKEIQQILKRKQKQLYMTGSSLSRQAPLNSRYQNFLPSPLKKSLKAAVGTVHNIRRLRDGNILVEVANAAQSLNIMKLHTLVDCPVTVSPTEP